MTTQPRPEEYPPSGTRIMPKIVDGVIQSIELIAPDKLQPRPETATEELARLREREKFLLNRLECKVTMNPYEMHQWITDAHTELAAVRKRIAELEKEQA